MKRAETQRTPLFYPLEGLVETDWAVATASINWKFDLIGKGRRLRTVPVPSWSKQLLDAWLVHSGVSQGRVFRRISKKGKRQEAGVTANVVWYAVKRCARQAGIANLAPHDLRRTCARLCHDCNGELEQIRFLLGHASVQTTERYIGSKQKLQDAVNDRFEILVAKYVP